LFAGRPAATIIGLVSNRLGFILNYDARHRMGHDAEGTE